MRRFWRVVLAAVVGVAGLATTLRRESPGEVMPAPAPPLRASPHLNRFLFSVYPGGASGEIKHVKPADPKVIDERLSQLQGGGPPLNVHLYLAWKDVVEPWFWPYYDAEFRRYETAGQVITLTIRYAPPPGRAGDAMGFAEFCRAIVGRYGVSPAALRFVVGNEANATGNPDASDGPFAGVRDGIARGVVAARAELDRLGAPAEVGVNMAVTGVEADTAFLRDLGRLGGPRFYRSVAFLGVDVYPGIWPPGTGDPYADMRTAIVDARRALDGAGFDRSVKLDVLENGFPTADEQEQADRLTAMVRAVLDCRDVYGVVAYSWFDLWDADSSSNDRFAHYGLLRSDLTPKLSFHRYRELIRLAADRPAAESRPATCDVEQG